MENLTLWMLALLVIALGLTWIAIWSPRRPWVKMISVILAVFVFGLGYVSFSDLLSRPKPTSLEWMQRSAKDAQVLSARIIEGKGIYLLLELREFSEPRYYVLPWNRDLAEQLQKEMREAQRKGIPLMLKNPFKRSWDKREKKFYALPQPAAPPKDMERGTPEQFVHPQYQEEL